MRRAYADRALYLGDQRFNPTMPITQLLSKPYADKLRSTIDQAKASVSDSSLFSAAYLQKDKLETTHISIVDKNGNAVSLTYTLESGYGAAMVVEGAGFLLNNQMGDFNPIPGVTNSTGQIGTAPNLIAPEKRMLSSMTPTIIVKEGKPIMVIGTPGGRTTTNTVLQVILNVLEHKMNIGEAVEAPRIHHQWLPDVTDFQGIGISPDTRKLYGKMGHRIVDIPYRGEAMGIIIDKEKGLLYGAADSRSFDGKAVGY
jgi:gamma-glutamyltranspeptidase/glutathione hydrolase